MSVKDQLSRRDFARLLAVSGSLFSVGAFVPATRSRFSLSDLGLADGPLPAPPPSPSPADPGEPYWLEVRSRFLLPNDLAFLNAANLCPTSLPVLEAIERHARAYEAGPVPAMRNELVHEREPARQLLAAALRVTPEEIVITRNTSEGNNLVSSGLDLGPRDEVVVHGDNHPSNLEAWRAKGKRFGFTVVTVPEVNPHPGTEALVGAFASAFTPRTRVLAFSHVSSNSGDLFPAAELCRLARERGVLSLVDGAQSFGVVDVDLAAMRPDFFTGSMHKWPCGPKETGVLFVDKGVHDRIAPSLISLYAGAVGISKKLEAVGQRDDAKIAAVSEAMTMQGTIGREVVDRRTRALANVLVDGLRGIDGVQLWTHPDPLRHAAIVIFRPGSLDPRKLAQALEVNDRIVCTPRAGADRPGIRFSPNFYNTMAEMDRAVGAIRKYMAAGV